MAGIDECLIAVDSPTLFAHSKARISRLLSAVDHAGINNLPKELSDALAGLSVTLYSVLRLAAGATPLQ